MSHRRSFQSFCFSYSVGINIVAPARFYARVAIFIISAAPSVRRYPSSPPNGCGVGAILRSIPLTTQSDPSVWTYTSRYIPHVWSCAQIAPDLPVFVPSIIRDRTSSRDPDLDHRSKNEPRRGLKLSMLPSHPGGVGVCLIRDEGVSEDGRELLRLCTRS